MQKGNLLEQNEDGDVTVVEFFTENLGTDAESRAADMSDALRSGRDPYVTVHRITGSGNAPEEYVTRLPADKFDFGQLQEFIAKNYGGGDYRVRLYSSNKLVKSGNRMISIAHPVEKPMNQDQGLLSVLIQKMDRQNEILMAALTKKVEVQPQQFNRESYLDELLKMKALFGGSGGGGIESIKEALGFVKELGLNIGHIGQEKEEAGFSELLAQFAPLVTQAAYHPNPVVARPNGQQSQAYKDNPIKPNPQRSQQMNMQQMQLRFGLGQLLTAARKNSDPGHWAITVLDMLDGETVRQFISEGDPVKKMIELCPDVEAHQQWFRLLAEHLKALLGLPSTVSDEYDTDDDQQLDSDNVKSDL
jgi:hypothetical protein